MTRIGQYRYRARIEQPVLTDDGQGGHATSWAVLAVVYANVKPMAKRPQDGLLAAQITSELLTEVTIRYRTDVSAKQRVRIGARTLQIEGFRDLEQRKDELQLICTEVMG